MTQTQTRPASVYLVSGGAKGITAECTIKLAQKQPAKFILLGRSELLEIEPDYAQNCAEEPALKKRIMENLQSQGEKPTPISVQKIYNKIHSRPRNQKNPSSNTTNRKHSRIYQRRCHRYPSFTAKNQRRCQPDRSNYRYHTWRR